MTTFANFVSQFRREVREETPTVWSDESIMYWKNEATTKVAMRTDEYIKGDWYRNSVASQQSYDLPDDILQVHALYYDEVLLTREDFENWSVQADLDDEDTPTHYVVANRKLWLRPIPPSAKQMRFFVTRIPDATTDTSSTEAMPFESRYDDAIMYYVKAKAFEQTDAFDRADRYKARFEQALAEAIQQSALERIAGGKNEVTNTEGW
jgi:hypothetical protein